MGVFHGVERRLLRRFDVEDAEGVISEGMHAVASTGNPAGRPSRRLQKMRPELRHLQATALLAALYSLCRC